MNDTLAFIKSLTPQQEQWPMSYAYSEPGQSLPEYHPEGFEIATGEGTGVALGATDEPTADDIVGLIQDMIGNIQTPATSVPGDISKALDKLLGNQTELKIKAQKDMYTGAVLKTVAAAGDLFDRAVGIAAGQIGNIRKSADIAEQNYQNQMDALDNQVLYIKHQLADRFNKTVETNIMNLAARNLRVTSGNVLELTKDTAQEMTEDMREAESNARLKQIALEAGKKSARESAKYAEKQVWTGLIGSATKLGLAVATGGGTNESWGNLYSGYKTAKAVEAGSLTKIY